MTQSDDPFSKGSEPSAAPGVWGAPPPVYGQQPTAQPQPYGQAPGYGQPSPYGQQPPYGPYGGWGQQATGTNGLAIASLVCGIVGFLYGIPAIVAIVLGFVARSQMKARPQSGGGMALAGIILGFAWIGLFVFFVLAVALI